MTNAKDWITAQPPVLLSEQTETPVEETGDVERDLQRVMFEALSLMGRYDLEGHPITRQKADAEMLASLALAAMRPVSVDEGKLAEIRARHERVASKEFPNEDELWEAHADRAFLLSVIEGVEAQ